MLPSMASHCFSPLLYWKEIIYLLTARLLRSEQARERQCERCQPLFRDEDIAAEKQEPPSPLLKGRADAKYQDHPHYSRQGSYLATLGSEGTVQSLHQHFLDA